MKEGQSDSNSPDIITMEEDDSEEIKREIKDVLIEFRIRDYVAMTDLKDQHKVMVLRKEDAEKLGAFNCRHCGMEFTDEIQFGMHQRVHLPI